MGSGRSGGQSAAPLVLFGLPITFIAITLPGGLFYSFGQRDWRTVLGVLLMGSSGTVFALAAYVSLSALAKRPHPSMLLFHQLVGGFSVACLVAIGYIVMR